MRTMNRAKQTKWLPVPQYIQSAGRHGRVHTSTIRQFRGRWRWSNDVCAFWLLRGTVRSVYVYSVYQYPMYRVTKSKQIDLASNVARAVVMQT